MIYNKKPIIHGYSTIPTNSWVVYARQGDTSRCHICHTYLVFAFDGNDAIERLKANAQAVIEEVRKNLQPADFVKNEWVETPGLTQLKQVRDYEERVELMMDKLDDLGDADDDMSNVWRESLTENIRISRDAIKKLKNGCSLGYTSTFDYITRNMRYLLGEDITFDVVPLTGDRCYPVAYFDDHRSITSYCPTH